MSELYKFRVTEALLFKAVCDLTIETHTQKERIAELEAAAARAAAFVLPTGYDEDLALKMMTNAETYGFAFVADREFKRAERAEAELAALKGRFEAAQCCGSCCYYTSFGSALYCTIEVPERIHAYDHERDFSLDCQYEPSRWAERGPG